MKACAGQSVLGKNSGEHGKRAEREEEEY